MDSIFLLLLLLGAGLLIFKVSLFKGRGILTYLPATALLLKLLTTFLLIWIYTHHYDSRGKADIFRYFDDAQILAGIAGEDLELFTNIILNYNESVPEQQAVAASMDNWDRAYTYGLPSDDRTIIRINSLLFLISGGSYLNHAFFFSLLAFVGSILLFYAFKEHYSNNQTLLFVAVVLPPGLFFWSSGILKESILIFGLGVFLYAGIALAKKASVRNLVFFLSGMLILSLVKIYILIIVFPLFLIFLITKKMGGKSGLVYLVTLLIGTTLFFSSDTLPEIIARKQKDSINEAFLTDAGSYIPVKTLSPNFSSYLRKTPEALQNAMFRPLPGEISGWPGMAASVENILFILLIILTLIFFKKPSGKDWSLLFFLVTTSLMIFLLAGMVSPVLGTLIRYRVPALPFAYMALFLVFDIRKFTALCRTVIQRKQH